MTVLIILTIQSVVAYDSVHSNTVQPLTSVSNYTQYKVIKTKPL